MKSQFLLDPEIVYLNHGSFGAIPKPVLDNLQYLQRKMELDSVQFLDSEIFPNLAKSRHSLGNFIGCNGDDLVYYPNPTHAVNAVARSLQLHPGDEVLITNHIYGALDFTWKEICQSKNAKLVKANIPLPVQSSESILKKIFNHVTKNTQVIFISELTSMTAMIFPVKEIINFCKERKILSIIDGAHIPGHLPLNITELDPDIYTGACHKWMCAPKGTSFLYVKKNLQDEIMPPVISWGWEVELLDSSRFLNRHEWQGTRDMTPFLAVPAAIDFLQQNDWLERAKINHKLVVDSRKMFCHELAIEPLCPDENLAQMASIPIPVKDPVAFKQSLMEKYNIQVPIYTWEDQTYLRFSMHLYNAPDDLQKLFTAVMSLLV